MLMARVFTSFSRRSLQLATRVAASADEIGGGMALAWHPMIQGR